jgi:hypothetical protein
MRGGIEEELRRKILRLYIRQVEAIGIERRFESCSLRDKREMSKENSEVASEIGSCEERWVEERRVEGRRVEGRRVEERRVEGRRVEEQ